MQEVLPIIGPKIMSSPYAQAQYTAFIRYASKIQMNVRGMSSSEIAV